jgi:cbb3-type cytochrome c oxidase subunit I/cbb3-type cytochrome c oxidase subunit III
MTNKRAQSNAGDAEALVLPERATALIKAHAFAAIATLVISVLFGLVVSLKLHNPDLMSTSAAMTWGRLRYNHTQGIFFGWLGNAFLMFLYYAVPQLAMKPVLSRKLGWLLFVLWNFAVLVPGWVLVFAGVSQPLEWGEFPLVIDALVVVGFILSIAQFVYPLLRSKLSSLYVSGWYILGGLIFTSLAYPVGNIVPQLVPGASGAAFSGLWIHDAIGLFVTPLALAIAYYVIPAATRRPIYSHFLSMIGFWLLFFVYPFNGTHHYVFSSIPMEAQKAAIVASIYLGVDVSLVVANLLLSLRGASALLKKDLSLRFVWMGTILYLIVSLQGSLQSLMPVNKLVHFSDWVIGHAHLAMLGFATFTAIGGITHIWQRLPGVKFNRNALSWCYWLLLHGLVFMVGSLTIAGLIEAHMWQSSLPWLESVRSVKAYWVFRSFVGLAILGAFISLWLAMTTGVVVGVKASEKVGEADERGAAEETTVEEPLVAAPASSSRLNMAYLSASVGGIALFLFSFGLLAVYPGWALNKEIARTKPASMVLPTASEERGRLIYAKEGCAYCHTQQVRVVENDVERFGAPTRAWETTYEYPHLWGTRRIGPDLAREAGIRSDDWQLTHLYNPRFVVPDSPMPGFHWLFDGAASAPRQEALDLLAYIKSLGRARQLTGNDRSQFTVPSYCQCQESIKQIERQPTSLSVSPAMARQSKSTLLIALTDDPTELATQTRRGAQLFKQDCAGCHGAGGEGNGPAAASLLPQPLDLTSNKLSPSHIGCAILNGVPGSSMPAWRDLPQRDVEALVAFVSSLSKVEKAKPSQDLARGQALFQKECSSCHGAAGDGNGPAAAAFERCPTNFKVVLPGPEFALKAIDEGIPGTGMPPWKEQLAEADRRLLAAYVRSLYQGVK